MTPQPIPASTPPSKEPVPPVFPGNPPVPPENTVSLVLNTNKDQPKAKTQPLVVSPNAQWTDPVQVQSAKKEPPASGWQKAVVTYVVDGDTAKLKTNKGLDLNCRLDFIDAPEMGKNGKKGQDYGEQSKKSLQDMISNKEVSVKVSNGVDEYGRQLCSIEVEGENVNLAQVKKGAAWMYKQYGLPSEYIDAQTKARMNQDGLWKNPEAIHPRNFKHQ